LGGIALSALGEQVSQSQREQGDREPFDGVGDGVANHGTKAMKKGLASMAKKRIAS
jgi:hypothetical protein